jgi:predicted secreted hydrolase
MGGAGRACGLVLAGVVAAGAASAIALAGATQEAAPGFAEALSSRAFVFPRDHGPHQQFRQEWWYLTGNLEAADGARFGFELTFFRFALAPEGTPAVAAQSSAWRTRQIYMAHFAITDAGRGSCRSAQRLERDALGLAGAEGEPLRVWTDDWSLSTPAGPAAAAAGAGAWRARAAEPGYALDLELTALAPPVPNGAAGLSVKSGVPGDATYYYSIPRLAATGRLVRDGRALAVKGLAWFDREWGSGGLGPNEIGWDWFGLQLADGSALMFYVLRDRDGGRDPHSAGTWVDPAGRARALSSDEVQIEITGHWTDRDGVRYPAGWRLVVPSLALNATVHPVLADQELKTQPRYWEGAVDVGGERAGQRVAGRGYVELVGYGTGR